MSRGPRNLPVRHGMCQVVTPEIQRSFAASVSAAIAGLHENLVGDLVHFQKEQEYRESTLQWDDIRAKAGAREGYPGSSLKRRKLAPAAVAAQDLAMENIQATIRTATEEAVRTALSHSGATGSAAPTASIAPLIPSEVVDTIMRGSATATRSAIDEFARSATAMVVQPGLPQQPQQPTRHDGDTRQESPYKRHASWPGICRYCNVLHQRFEECPRCICRRCSKQGHTVRGCKEVAACSDCGSKSGQGHTQSCKAKNQGGRRQ